MPPDTIARPINCMQTWRTSVLEYRERNLEALANGPMFAVHCAGRQKGNEHGKIESEKRAGHCCDRQPMNTRACAPQTRPARRFDTASTARRTVTFAPAAQSAHPSTGPDNTIVYSSGWHLRPSSASEAMGRVGEGGRGDPTCLSSCSSRKIEFAERGDGFTWITYFWYRRWPSGTERIQPK